MKWDGMGCDGMATWIVADVGAAEIEKPGDLVQRRQHTAAAVVVAKGALQLPDLCGVMGVVCGAGTPCRARTGP